MRKLSNHPPAGRLLDFEDTTKYPTTPSGSGGTMTQAAFLAASGVTRTSTITASGSFTVETEGNANVIRTTATGGGAIGANVARFGSRRADVSGLRKEPPAENLFKNSRLGANASLTGVTNWSNGGSLATNAGQQAGPDGTSNATHVAANTNGFSNWQTSLGACVVRQPYTFSYYGKAGADGIIRQYSQVGSAVYYSKKTGISSAVWSRIVFGVVSGFNGTLGTCIYCDAEAATGWYSAAATEAYQDLVHAQIGSYFPHSPLISPSGSTCVAGSELDTATTPTDFVVDGKVPPYYKFIVDGNIPRDYTNDIYLYYADANNHLRIIGTGTNDTNKQLGGWLALTINGIQETIGRVIAADKDIVELWVQGGNGTPFSAWQRTNGSSVRWLGEGTTVTPFAGASFSTVAAHLYDNGTVTAFSGVVCKIGWMSAAPSWVPASRYTLDSGTISSSSSAADVTPFSSGQLASALDGTDFFLRAVFTATGDFQVRSATGDVWIVSGATAEGNFGLRYVQSSQLYVMQIAGVDQTFIFANTANTVAWASGNEVIVEMWWQQSIGQAGFRFIVNGTVSEGFDDAGNWNRPHPLAWAPSTLVTTASVNTPRGFPDGTYKRCTTGGTTVGTEPQNNSGATLAADAATWHRDAGTTTTESGGVVWVTQDGPLQAGAGLSAVSSLHLGSRLGIDGFLDATWTRVSFMHRGTSFDTSTAHIIFLGDSQIASWLRYTPVPAQIRSAAESRGRPLFVAMAHPGAYAGVSTPTAVSQWSMNRYARDPGLLGVVIQIGTNDDLANQTSATIISRIQTLIDTIRTTNTSCWIFLAEIPPERGALTAGQYTVWQAVNQAIDGGGGTPITDSANKLVRMGGVAANNNGSDFLVASADAGDHLHQNTVGRNNTGVAWRTQLDTKSSAVESYGLGG